MAYSPFPSFLRLVAMAILVAGLASAPGEGGADSPTPPSGGALTGARYRVLISTDLGGGDEDDKQSLVHYLIYADLFDTEGLVASPPQQGRKADILSILDGYAQDYPRLRAWSDRYPSPDALRAITKQGATDPAPAEGFSRSTEGSRWIIECAHRDDPRPLYVLVWGSITDVAQALRDDPSIKNKIRVYFIASWNLRQDPAAFAYIEKHHPDLWIIVCDTTFRGWYVGGDQEGEWSNSAFPATHVSGRGALGDLFMTFRAAGARGDAIKMGDTPSVAYLLRGDPDDPTTPSWGGHFRRHPERPHWFLDLTDEAWTARSGSAVYPGANTVNQWRRAYLADWAQRMERCRKEKE